MTCLARLYEPNGHTPTRHVDLTSTSVQALAVDQGTLSNLCHVQNNASLPGGGYGVQLSFSPSDLVYQVALNDPTSIYAGFTVLNLNGRAAGNLDLVVHRLPTSRTSGSMTSPVQARAAVLTEPFWSEAEKIGVIGLMTAYSLLQRSTDPTVQNFTKQYAISLDRLGIDFTIL